MIYLDHAATTPMRPRAWEAMSALALESFGNSSGVHEVSREAKNALEDARERVASLIGAEPMEIVFTSGGTESDNLALKGAALSSSPSRGLVAPVTEHEAVLESADFLKRLGYPVTLVPVDSRGLVDLEALIDSVTEDTSVVSVMMVNNETGLIQDLASMSHALGEQRPGVHLHTDAVQGYVCESVNVDDLGVDMMTITGHKFGGPKGAGLLYVRKGVALEPLLHGGGQELGRRSGTHDVAGAVGLAVAMEEAAGDRVRFNSEVGRARDSFERTLVDRIDGLVLNSTPGTRSPHHCNVRIPGVRNETLLVRLDQAGVAASAGSACQSGAAAVSHVLEGMGRSADEARESLRFSFGWTSTMAEAEAAADVVVELVGSLR